LHFKHNFLNFIGSLLLEVYWNFGSTIRSKSELKHPHWS